MDFIPAPSSASHRNPRELGRGGVRDSSGIALFMVISAVSVLAILVTEFTYIAHVSEMIAFGGLDQAKAHYLAKSGLKISLLRLKAYAQVKKMLGGKSGGASANIGQSIGIPKGYIEKIWNFPLYYPIPTNIPGMGVGEKDSIEKFQKESNLEGKYSAIIESESSRFNLNMILSSYAPTGSPSGTPSPPPTQPPPPGGTPPATPPPGQPQGNTTNVFDPKAAQEGLYTYLNTILTQKNEADPDFATNYRDFRLPDLVDQIITWADRTYERQTSPNLDKLPPKRAPFYSKTELHALMDDDLYDLFAPNLTASTTLGININTIQEATLHALVPAMTKDELKEFFKFRDSEESDNFFGSDQDFYKYLEKNVNTYKSNQQALKSLQDDLAKRNVRIVTDENQFKITVRAQVNQAIRTIEAWVTLLEDAGTPATPPGMQQNPAPPTNNPASPQNTGPNSGGLQGNQPPSPGIKITYMRIS